MFRKAFFAAAIVLCVTTVASAVPTIVAGDHTFGADSGAQSFYITTTGGQGDEFLGADLYFEILGTGAPIVTGFDMLNDSSLLFFGNNHGTQGGFPDFDPPTTTPAGNVSTLTGSVGPNGNLALVTIDTNGVAAGDYQLVLTHPILGDSDLPPFSVGFETVALLSNGMIHITNVPEPSSIVMGLFAAAGLGVMVIRRRRVRKSA